MEPILRRLTPIWDVPESRRIPARIFYERVRDAILFRQPAPVSLRDATTVKAILETSFQSEAEGRILPIPLTEVERAEWK